MRGVFTHKISHLVWKCGVLSSVHEKVTWQEGCSVMNHYCHLRTSPSVRLLIVFLHLTQMLDAFDSIWCVTCVCVPHSGKRESLRLCQIARNAHQSEHGGPSRADAHTPLWAVPPLQTRGDGLQGYRSWQQALQVICVILLFYWTSKRVF